MCEYCEGKRRKSIKYENTKFYDFDGKTTLDVMNVSEEKADGKMLVTAICNNFMFSHIFEVNYCFECGRKLCSEEK